MKEVGLNESSVEVEEPELDMSQMTDREILLMGMRSTGEAEQLELAQTIEAREARIAEVLEEIEAYYGDEIITYNDYTGTARFVAEACPIGRMMAAQGFDVFKDWLEANRTAAKPEVVNITEEESDETVVIDNEGDDLRTELEKPVEKPKELTKLQQVEADSSRVKEGKPVSEPEVTAETATTKQESIAVATPSRETKLKVEVEHQRDEVEKTAPIANPVPEVSFKVEQEVDVQESAPVVFELSAEEIATTDSANEAEVASEIVETAEIKSVVTIETLQPETEPESSQSLTEVLESEIVPDTVELDDTPLEEVEATEAQSDIEQDEVYAVYEQLSESAKQEPPLEMYLVEAIQALDRVFELPEDDDDTERALNSEVAQHDGLESIIEMELLDDNESLDAFDDEGVLQEARAEVIALLLPVKKARQAVDKLFEAKTKEECLVHLQELKQELASLLYSLGYENPELIVQQFLTTYSPKVLQGLLVELEKTLRRVAYRTARAKQASYHQIRHTRFEKFLQFIMQSVTSKHVETIS